MKRFSFCIALMAFAALSYASVRIDSIISYEYETWHEAGIQDSAEWRLLDTAFVYDANNLTSKQTYDFRSLENDAMGRYLIKSEGYVYDINNQCIEHTRSEWVDGFLYSDPKTWECIYKEEFTYQNGKLHEKIEYAIDAYAKQLQLSYKEVYTCWRN